MPVSDTNMWDVLNSLMVNLPAVIAAVAAIIGIIMNNTRAKEVKADLATAKTELKADTAAQNSTLTEVKVAVNGNLDREKKARVALEAQVRELGATPVTDRPEPS